MSEQNQQPAGQTNLPLQVAYTPVATETTHIWAKVSLIAGVASWISFALAFLLPLLMTTLLMGAVATSTADGGNAGTPITAQIAIFISSVALFGYPIGMALGLLGLIAGVVVLRKVPTDQSAVASKNMALAGAALGGVSLVPTCFLLFGVGMWGALAVVMGSSGR